MCDIPQARLVAAMLCPPLLTSVALAFLWAGLVTPDSGAIPHTPLVLLTLTLGIYLFLFFLPTAVVGVPVFEVVKGRTKASLANCVLGGTITALLSEAVLLPLPVLIFAAIPTERHVPIGLPDVATCVGALAALAALGAVEGSMFWAVAEWAPPRRRHDGPIDTALPVPGEAKRR